MADNFRISLIGCSALAYPYLCQIRILMISYVS